MKNIEAIGKHLTEGALMAIGKWIIIATLGIAVWQWAFPPARDATDASSGPRSGMRLRVDHGTGCQYLETRQGALVPRMGDDGKQVCAPTGTEGAGHGN